VLVIERIESLDLLKDRSLCRVRKRIHAGRHHDAATPESFPEDIVQCASLRALCIFIFFISLTHTTSVALPARQPYAGERDRGFPSSPFILSRRCAWGSTCRARTGHVATGGDRPRQGASSRQRLCRVRFMWRSPAECRRSSLSVCGFCRDHFLRAAYRTRLQTRPPTMRPGQRCDTRLRSRNREHFP